MTTTPAVVPVKSNAALLIVLGLAAALLTLGVLLGWALPFNMTERSAFLALAVIGFTMCGLSPLGKGMVYGWLHPLHLVGYGLGAAALYLIAANLFNLPQPTALSAHAGIPALAGLMGLKVVVAMLYPRKP